MLKYRDRAINCRGAEQVEASLAVVVFVGCSTLRWLSLLRRGYRHCFVAVATTRGWVVHDPRCHRTEVSVLEPIPAAELVAHFRLYGCMAVATQLRFPSPRMAPPGPHTCVESVKRILGVRSWRVFTPRQLFRYLRQEELS